MSKRVSQIILLCEDEEHERLAKSYMEKCGINKRTVQPLVASQMQAGGNVGWVLNEFPKQLHACRQRQKRAQTLLVVLVDADQFTVEERRRQLAERVKAAGFDEFGPNEPVALLIPKRNIATWIRALLGETVTEEQDYKTRNKPTKEELRKASETLFQWTRPNATPGATCRPSLETALCEWAKIGQRRS